MKKLYGLLIFIFFGVFIIPVSVGYYGDGDCTHTHELKILNVNYNPDAEIILDGCPNESFWEGSTETSLSHQINLSKNINEPNFYLITLNITFVRNNNYLLILCEWKDNTTLPDLGNDGLYFCWNIDVPEFSAYYPGGMDTSHMGGGYIDSWLKIITSLNQTNGNLKDQSFGPDGYTTENDLITIEMGYKTKINESYCVEIRRELITTDNQYDVQFNQNILYKFNLGIMDDAVHGEEHAISYTHALDFGFKTNAITGYYLFPIFFSFLLSVSYILISYKKNNRR